MTHLPRATIAVRVAGLAVVGALTLTACGGNAVKATSSPTASRSTTTSSPSSTPSPSSASADGKTQVVKVEKYGISFEIPKDWITLDAKKILSKDNPGLKDLAKRMGMSVERLNSTLAAGMEVYAVTNTGAVGGYLDNVNVTGQRGTDLNDDQMKLQFAALGAKLGPFEHSSSPAGDVTRVPFTLPVAGRTAYGVSVVVFTDDSTVNITAGAHSASVAKALADQIEESLGTIPGNGPDL